MYLGIMICCFLFIPSTQFLLHVSPVAAHNCKVKYTWIGKLYFFLDTPHPIPTNIKSVAYKLNTNRVISLNSRRFTDTVMTGYN